jgi:hypothetical protein
MSYAGRLRGASFAALLLSTLVVASGSSMADASTAAGTTSSRAAASRLISLGQSFHIQFAGTLDESVNADVYEVDSTDTPKSVVTDLHAQGRIVVCYISGGSWENYRPDAAKFPKRVLGRTLAGWPAERWLDIRKVHVLMPLMKARMDVCVRKGFDGIEFDNVDGQANRTGFPLTRAQQIRYDKALAHAAVAKGLQPGLKNAPELVPALVDSFGWALNEQCVQYSECKPYKAFTAQGKAVFVLEYNVTVQRMCKVTGPLNLYAQKKKLSLNAWRRTCP